MDKIESIRSSRHNLYWDLDPVHVITLLMMFSRNRGRLSERSFRMEVDMELRDTYQAMAAEVGVEALYLQETAIMAVADKTTATEYLSFTSQLRPAEG